MLTIVGLGLVRTMGAGAGVAVPGRTSPAILSTMLAFGAVPRMYLVTERRSWKRMR